METGIPADEASAIADDPHAFITNPSKPAWYSALPTSVQSAYTSMLNHEADLTDEVIEKQKSKAYVNSGGHSRLSKTSLGVTALVIGVYLGNIAVL